LPTKYYAADQIEKNETGGERCIQGFVWKTEGNRPLGRSGLDGRIIRRIFMEVGWRDTDWIDLAQDSDRRRAFVNAVMNLRVP
jgi:hypothetical protein